VNTGEPESIGVGPAEAVEFFTTTSAEKFCALPPNTLRTIRKRDRRRIRYGLPRDGPAWIEISERRIRYWRTELIRWMKSKTIAP
jgi:hypothetical protein